MWQKNQGSSYSRLIKNVFLKDIQQKDPKPRTRLVFYRTEAPELFVSFPLENDSLIEIEHIMDKKAR